MLTERVGVEYDELGRSSVLALGMALLGLIAGPLALVGGVGVLLGLFEQSSVPLFLLTALEVL